jgi:cyclopropane-fatty-acyl-phospholipid synthase
MGDGAKNFALRLLETAGVPVNGTEPWSLQVRDERLWDRVVSQRQLGMGEAYMDGWWESDAMDDMLTRILVSDVLTKVRVGPKLAGMAAQSFLVNRQTQHRAAQNARHHYDIGNDLYERMLDERMVYSCGYWETANDLATAQRDKLDLICRKLGLEPGMRLLDIGCGWGGLLHHAATHYGVTGTGISPAGNQVEIASRRCADLPVDIRQQDYRQLVGRFDRIVSVGMMEHVGPRNLPAFFSTCDRLLDEGGTMLHHTIGSTISKHHTDPFFDRYIFPGGVVPSLAQFNRAAEPNWVVEDVHNFGPDYDRTLMAWHDNIEARWHEIPKYDERFRRMWRYYLLSSAAGFRARNLQLWQVVMRRRGSAPRYVTVR